MAEPRLRWTAQRNAPAEVLTAEGGTARLRQAVFLDRDGTLVRDVHHGADPLAAEVLPGTTVALGALQRRGYALVVVSNQSGVGRGLFSLAEARWAASYLCAWLDWHGVRLDGFYFCPHRPVEGQEAPGCSCRKPAPGMLFAAARQLGLDLQRSWMIGDALSDVVAGARAGCRSILVDIGSLDLATLEGETNFERWPWDADGRGDERSKESHRPQGCIGRHAARPLRARSLAHAVALVLERDGFLPLPLEAAGSFGSVERAARAGSPTVGTASPWPDGLRMAWAQEDAARLARWLEELDPPAGGSAA